MKEKTGSIVNRNGKLYARVTFTDKDGHRRDITRKAEDTKDAKRLIREMLSRV